MSDETRAWVVAGDIARREPAYGIMAAWAVKRWRDAHPRDVGSLWDESYCRDVRGEVACAAYVALPLMTPTAGYRGGS